MYFRKIDDKIIDCANFKYHKDAIFTNKNIIRKYTGEMVFEEDFVNSATMEDLQKQKIFEENLKNSEI